MKLHDQVAIVTGAASGIGRELSKQLAVAGCHLALADIDETGLNSLRSELIGGRSRVSIHKIDVAEKQLVEQTVNEVVGIHGRISIVVNNAAVSISAPFEEVSLEDYARLIGTNFWGTVYLCRYALPFLRNEREACIVNVLSSFALLGFPNKTAYCSSKAALLGFSNALYTELNGTGVRVSVVIPPAVATNLIRNGATYDETKKQREVMFLERHGVAVETVARTILRGMVRGKFVIRVGPLVRALDLLCRCFPTATHTLLARNKAKIDFI